MKILVVWEKNITLVKSRERKYLLISAMGHKRKFQEMMASSVRHRKA